MLFKQGVEAVLGLRDAYRPGLGAIKAQYRDRIFCADTRRLKGSVDLDSALQESLPNDPRWDYGIGVAGTNGKECIHWIEVHPATEGDVKEVLKKHCWLREWLHQHAPALLRMTACAKGYAWVATKSVGFHQGSPRARQLAAQGVSFPCKRFAIP